MFFFLKRFDDCFLDVLSTEAASEDGTVGADEEDFGKGYKKKRGLRTFAYPAILGLRIAFGYRISNAEAHADGIQ